LHKNDFPASNAFETFQNPVKRWFALRVKSRCEKTVAMMAQGKCIETFLPAYQCRRRWSDRDKLIEYPLFPGYIFCRLDPNQRLRLLTIPGVVHFVGIGKTPVPIDDIEIAALQAAMQSGLQAEPWPFLEVGQRVRLEDGPLTGIEGIFMGDAKKERIVVSITLLRRSVAIAIERHWVKPVNETGRQAQRVSPRSRVDLTDEQYADRQTQLQ
jgi:transcription antitermination factor NusG